MISKIVQLLLCMLGRHKRKGAAARQVDGEFVSVCRGCGIPMIRDIGGWKVREDVNGHRT